ncbi:Retrovirus-related Pol polyprotein from transposon TNT 1-94 [Cardamine amara subsp. amara]|uniref:Retrovirus-related Pol polyprotein from transposon TNT 1-94 n=1 Tax=Cardamine amara subsp. amara TaxID=228776 RepID=A0ABD1B435_CARAN
MKDMGEAACILGIRIYRDRLGRQIGSCQDAYGDKVLDRFSMHDSKEGLIPMSHGINLSKTQCLLTLAERERLSRIPIRMQ